MAWYNPFSWSKAKQEPKQTITKTIIPQEKVAVRSIDTNKGGVTITGKPEAVYPKTTTAKGGGGGGGVKVSGAGMSQQQAETIATGLGYKTTADTGTGYNPATKVNEGIPKPTSNLPTSQSVMSAYTGEQIIPYSDRVKLSQVSWGKTMSPQDYLTSTVPTFQNYLQSQFYQFSHWGSGVGQKIGLPKFLTEEKHAFDVTALGKFALFAPYMPTTTEFKSKLISSGSITPSQETIFFSKTQNIGEGMRIDAVSKTKVGGNIDIYGRQTGMIKGTDTSSYGVTSSRSYTQFGNFKIARGDYGATGTLKIGSGKGSDILYSEATNKQWIEVLQNIKTRKISSSLTPSSEVTGIKAVGIIKQVWEKPNIFAYRGTTTKGDIFGLIKQTEPNIIDTTFKGSSSFIKSIPKQVSSKQVSSMASVFSSQASKITEKLMPKTTSSTSIIQIGGLAKLFPQQTQTKTTKTIIAQTTLKVPKPTQMEKTFPITKVSTVQLQPQVPISRTGQPQIPISVPKVEQPQIPIYKTPNTPLIVTPTIPTFPTTPFVPFIPSFDFGFSEGQTKRIIKGKQRYKYSPSFEALVFNIKGKQPKGLETGARVRPITKGYSFAFNKPNFSFGNFGKNLINFKIPQINFGKSIKRKRK